MATARDVVVNPLLCFAIHCYRKHPLKILKSITSDYYSPELVSSAKDRLVADIEAISPPNWKSLVKRRGENKFKIEIDDILSAITFADENGFLDKLPRYVVENLDDIPIMRMERGEFGILISKLDKLEKSVSTLRSVSSNVGQHSNRYDPPGHVLAAVSSDQPINQNRIPPTQPKPAEALSSRFVESSARQSIVEINESTDGGTDTGNSLDFTVATSRKKRRLSARTSPNDRILSQQPTMPTTEDSNPWSRLTASSNNVNRATPHTTEAIVNKKHSRKTFKFFGRSTKSNTDQHSTTIKLRAAKPYVKKTVYAIYNVDNAETAESMNEFLFQECGLRTISCFALKMPEGSESTTYRVCIDAVDSQKFFNEYAWASGIVIRPWKFNPKKAAKQAAPSTDVGTRSEAPGAVPAPLSPSTDPPVGVTNMDADDASHETNSV